MDTHGIILIFIAILEFILALYLFITRSKGHVIYSYALFILSVTLWVLGNGLFRILQNEAATFFWVRLLYFAAVLIAVTFVYFSFSFPYPLRSIRPYQTALLLLPLAIFFVIIFFGNTLIESIVGEPGTRQVTYGVAYHLFAVWFLLYFGWGLVNLVKRLPLASGFQYWQLRSLLIGIFSHPLSEQRSTSSCPGSMGHSSFFLGRRGRVCGLA